MGLTGRGILVTAALLTLVFFVGTLWVWPRLARTSWRSVLGRAGLLVTTQALLFAVVALAVNQTFGFYASWADLLGRERTPGVVVDQSAAPARPGASGAVDVSGRDAAVRVLGEDPVPGGGGARSGGRIERVEIAGRASRIASPALVYLPPEYFQPRWRDYRFPAVTVLTGYPGTASALVTGLRYPQTLRAEVRAGRAGPMVLVMLRPTVAPPRDTECVDVPGGPAVETYFAKDLPRAVAGHYRVARPGEGWGAVGDSTGGYCALKLAVHHPGIYAAGAGLSAYYRAAEDPTTGDLFHGDASSRRRADLLRVLRESPPPRTSLLVSSSRHGEDNYAQTRELLGLVRPPTRVSSVILDSGGHNFTTWRREIPATLRWLSERLGTPGEAR
ncbi:alpha/beta hydrolase [Streptomyces sp. NPDC007088]|uniref:alpha/beta hydrolase n=1 Tax=Streptomyces sp. NPDC007088 TaxID=3364773 RepID=UPI0036CE4ACA